MERGFVPPAGNNIRTVSVPAGLLTKQRIWTGFRLGETKRIIQEYDRLLEKEMGESFYFYTPQTGTDPANIIISHPHCYRYFIVEEGIGSYRRENIHYFRGYRWIALQVFKRLFPRIYTVKEYFVTVSHPKFAGCIGISEKVFPYLDRQCVQVLRSPFRKISLDEIPEAIIVLDYIQGFKRLSTTDYLELLRQLDAFFSTHCHYKELGFKFHPTHYLKHPEFVEDVRKLFQHFNQERPYLYREIAPEISLENIAFSYAPDFYGLFSSSLVYARIAGSNIYGLNILFGKISPAYRNIWEGLKSMHDFQEEELRLNEG